MFIGAFVCCLPLLWTYYVNPATSSALPPQASLFTRILSRFPRSTSTIPSSEGYTAISPDEDENSDSDPVVLELDDTLRGWRVCWMWFPAFFDSMSLSTSGFSEMSLDLRTHVVCGTTLMNVGLILTPVSIYQMSRGALVLWVGVLSVIFLRRRLWLYQWIALVIVTLGVCLVGLSGSLVKRDDPGEAGIVRSFVEIAGRSDDDPAKVALGVLLILFAQIFTATQYVRHFFSCSSEETHARRWWKRRSYPVTRSNPSCVSFSSSEVIGAAADTPLLQAAVSLEGFFGMLTTLIAMPILHIFLRARSPYFDVPRGWHQIISTPTVLGTCIAIMFSIGAFNFFGLSVTSRVSATTRSTIDTCRTLGIWVVSLGLGWERLVFPFSLLQVTGFAMLV